MFTPGITNKRAPRPQIMYQISLNGTVFSGINDEKKHNCRRLYIKCRILMKNS